MKLANCTINTRIEHTKCTHNIAHKTIVSYWAIFYYPFFCLLLIAPSIYFMLDIVMHVHTWIYNLISIFLSIIWHIHWWEVKDSSHSLQCHDLSTMLWWLCDQIYGHWVHHVQLCRNIPWEYVYVLIDLPHSDLLSFEIDQNYKNQSLDLFWKYFFKMDTTCAH